MDFVGAIGAALAQCAVGHPFDTVKVLLQSNHSSKVGILWNTLQRPSNLYRGVQYPLLSASISNVILFPIYERVTPYTGSPFLSGGIGGLVVAPILFYFDTYKVQRQAGISRSHVVPSYRSLGKVSNTLRETLAFSVYFSVYDECAQTRGWSALTAGAVAGLCNWGITFPLDTLKSQQIRHQITLPEALRRGGLYRGYSVALLRAVLVNGAVFHTYDALNHR